MHMTLIFAAIYWFFLPNQYLETFSYLCEDNSLSPSLSAREYSDQQELYARNGLIKQN